MIFDAKDWLRKKPRPAQNLTETIGSWFWVSRSGVGRQGSLRIFLSVCQDKHYAIIGESGRGEVDLIEAPA